MKNVIQMNIISSDGNSEKKDPCCLVNKSHKVFKLAIYYICFSLLLLLLIPGCQQNTATNHRIDIEAEKVLIAKAIDVYANTYVNEDEELLTASMGHDPDRVSIGTDEDEYFVGWQTVLDRFKMQFGRLRETSVIIQRRDIKVHESGKVAWFAQVWDMDTIAEGSHNKDNGMRLTGILEKRNDKWVIVQYHNSFPRKH